jgi:hypothetical protein
VPCAEGTLSLAGRTAAKTADPQRTAHVASRAPPPPLDASSLLT